MREAVKLRSPDGTPNRFMRFGVQSGIHAAQRVVPHCAKRAKKRAIGSMRATTSPQVNADAVAPSQVSLRQDVIRTDRRLKETQRLVHFNCLLPSIEILLAG